MKYYCNPINIPYKYQFNKTPEGDIIASREGADPSLIVFNEKYILFPSMACGFYYSEDLVSWEYHPTPFLPNYDYAPDVRKVGEYLYYCASNHEHGTYYRTKDPFSDDWEKLDGEFPFWDPNMFCDDDGRIYFYWGSSTTEPIYGIELDKDTLKPIGEKVPLIYADPSIKGFERSGEDHIPLRSKEEIDMILSHIDKQPMDESTKKAAIAYITGAPYIEGVWMTKKNGKYYLQYATPSSSFNTYSDGVYVSDRPLEGFILASNNPFSYKPSGFFSGAGHGSTMEDLHGNAWHIATGRICVNHNFERRIGLYPTGWDEEGEMFCNQRFGDFPIAVSEEKQDPWKKPNFMLLSYNKKVIASSEEKPSKNAVDEDIRTYWQAKEDDKERFVEIDLGKVFDVRAIQINFADSGMKVSLPENAKLQGALHQERWIDEVNQQTRWILTGSVDGKEYFVIKDKSTVNTDLPHDLIVIEEGSSVRFIRLKVIDLPYDQVPCVSGLRVFGLGHSTPPQKTSNVVIERLSDLDVKISFDGDAIGYNVLWGSNENKLYHSYQTFERSVILRGLIKGQKIFIRVDSFNESGITDGDVFSE